MNSGRKEPPSGVDYCWQQTGPVCFAPSVASYELALEIKSPLSRRHAARVGYFAVRLAARMGRPTPQIRRIWAAARLHDLGKLFVPESLLARPGPLSPKEFRWIERHPVVGAELLAKSGRWNELTRLVLHHHENFDGSGYPDRLTAEKIPFEARLIRVADSLEAMTSKRPYACAKSPADALAELDKAAGIQLDPLVVRHACELLVSSSGTSLPSL